MKIIKNERQLWNDYLFLSREMLSALTRQDMELFLEFMDQRGQLQTMIANQQDRSFSASEEGQRLFDQVRQYNQKITTQLRAEQNLIGKKQQVSQAYNAYRPGSGPRFSRKV